MSDVDDRRTSSAVAASAEDPVASRTQGLTSESEGFSTKEIEDLFVKYALMVDYLATPMPCKTRSDFRNEYKWLLDLYERASIDLTSSYMKSGDAHVWAIGDVGIGAAHL